MLAELRVAWILSQAVWALHRQVLPISFIVFAHIDGKNARLCLAMRHNESIARPGDAGG